MILLGGLAYVLVGLFVIFGLRWDWDDPGWYGYLIIGFLLGGILAAFRPRKQ